MESRNGAPIELDQLRAQIPAIFAGEAHGSRSERYAFISTEAVLVALGKEGFHPHSVLSAGSKFEDKRGFVKHLIRFRKQDVTIGSQGVTPEVCILGSHDGTTAWKAFMGHFRGLCKNGTIWFDKGATQVTIPHKGNVIDQVVEATYLVSGQSQQSMEVVNNFRTIDLTLDEQYAFAESARAVRFEDDTPVRPEQLLQLRREADRGRDLWTVFSRVQENVIKGELPYRLEIDTKDGGKRTVHKTTAPVRSVDGDLRLNRALWTLAAKMAELKGRA